MNSFPEVRDSSDDERFNLKLFMCAWLEASENNSANLQVHCMMGCSINPALRSANGCGCHLT